MAFTSRPTMSKRQRELDQRDRVAERAARRDARKVRAADRAAAGHVGPQMAAPAEITFDNDSAVADVAAPRLPAPQARGASTATRLYVGNLSYDATADSIRALFETKGEVSDVHIPIDRTTGRPRGFAFVTMGTAAAAQSARAELAGTMFDGRPLRVDAAEGRQDRGGPRGPGRF